MTLAQSREAFPDGRAEGNQHASTTDASQTVNPKVVTIALLVFISIKPASRSTPFTLSAAPWHPEVIQDTEADSVVNPGWDAIPGSGNRLR